MKTFQQWREEEIIQTPEEVRQILNQAIARISHLEPKEITDLKKVLIDLQTILDEKLAGF